MGRDPSISVVVPDLTCHDVPGLFVVDGSVLPGASGANPSSPSWPSPSAPARTSPALGTRRAIDLTLVLSLRSLATWLSALWCGGDRLLAELEGAATVDGLAHGRPCHGSLAWCPRGGAEALSYELAFDLADGTPALLRGDKHVHLPRLLRGLTHLHVELLEAETGVVRARGRCRFDLRTLPAFLASSALRPT